MQRLYAFIRRHPTLVDGFWAVILLGFSAVQWEASRMGHGYDLKSVPVLLGLCTALALRRRAPEKMLLLVTLLGVAQLVLDIEAGPADFAMLVLIYTVAADGERWASRFGLIGGLCAGTLAQLRWHEETAAGWVQEVVLTMVATVPFILAWVLGDSVRTRRAYFAQLEERAARLEREREAQSKVAVAGSAPGSPASCTTSSRTTSR